MIENPILRTRPHLLKDMNALLEKLGQLSERIKPGSLAWLKTSRLSTGMKMTSLLNVIGHENLTVAASTVPEAAATQSGTRVLPPPPRSEESVPRSRGGVPETQSSEVRLHPPAFARRLPPNFNSAGIPPAHGLAAEFQRLMDSKDSLDRVKAARLYLNDPQAFMASCQEAERAARASRQQARANLDNEIAAERQRRGWK